MCCVLLCEREFYFLFLCNQEISAFFELGLAMTDVSQDFTIFRKKNYDLYFRPCQVCDIIYDCPPFYSTICLREFLMLRLNLNHLIGKDVMKFSYSYIYDSRSIDSRKSIENIHASFIFYLWLKEIENTIPPFFLFNLKWKKGKVIYL